jgi:hypothetical protein
MNPSGTIFSQVLSHLPRSKFRRVVHKYRGNYRVRTFSCWDQFVSMTFAQLTYRESLRDIESCLRALEPKLYHVGIRTRISRNTLAKANETRDWRIYRDYAQHLIATARELYVDEDFGVELENTVYAFDSTTIDLCLSLFPWAKFMDHPDKCKGAVKLHTLLDLRGNIPTFVEITDGKTYDCCALDFLIIEPLAFYILDRGYHDFQRLYRIHKTPAFFVTRPRVNTLFRRLYSHPVDKAQGIICDQTILLTGLHTQHYYPEKLRRIRYYDKETETKLIFLTNNFELPSLTIAQLYKSRWQIELFFKWIKQHLRIKKFYGTSSNAVKTQVWIAVATYVLVAILKKRLDLPESLYTILQVLSVSLFEKTPILQAFQQFDYNSQDSTHDKQLKLFIT